MAAAPHELYFHFYTVLTDKDRVAQLNATYPDGRNIAPLAAATEYEAPFKYPPLDEKVSPKDAPLTFIALVTSGQNYIGSNHLSDNTWSQTGIDLQWAGGRTDPNISYTCFWITTFWYLPAPTDGPGGDPPPPVEPNIPKRRWLEGFEVPGGGPITGGVSGYGPSRIFYSRDASRHVGGLGLAVRAPVNGAYYAVASERFAAGSKPTKSWERLYVRVRRAPTTPFEFWRFIGTASIGWVVGLLPSGQLAVYTVDGTLTRALMWAGGSVPAWDGRALSTTGWHKLDVLVEIRTSVQKLALYLDGTLLTSQTAAIGAAADDYHGQSFLGNVVSAGGGGVGSDGWFDFDDWMQADQPSVVPSKDWLLGSSIRRAYPHGWASTHDAASWPGSWRTLMQIGSLASGGSGGEDLDSITSSTNGAVLAAKSDLEHLYFNTLGVMGIGAFLVCARGLVGAAPQCSVGYQLNGAGAVWTAQPSIVTTKSAGQALWTNPGDSTEFPTIEKVDLCFKHAADVTAGKCDVLALQVELVGQFGPEDVAPGQPALPASSRSLGQHNAPYPYTPWATRGVAPPLSPYKVYGGTYVGNGATGQDLTFNTPIHFLFIRLVTGATGHQPAVWCSPSTTPHATSAQASSDVARVEQNMDYAPGGGSPAQQYVARIQGSTGGGGLALNAVGSTYQYIAVADPGMRFLQCLPFVYHNSNGPTTEVPFPSPTWTPDWVFTFFDNLDSGGTDWQAQCVGQDAEKIARWTASVALTAAGSMSAGKLTTKSPLANLQAAVVHALWRKDDGSTATTAEKAAAVQVGTYVGNGQANLVINLATSGKRPLFAMVFSEAGTGSYRDPSHTSTNSTPYGGADAATGITAGNIDQFTVASALNANGVRYIYFVLMAGTTAGNNGWGTNDEYQPVAPGAPGDDLWPPEPPGPPDEPPGDEEEEDDSIAIPDDLTTDVAASCLVYSTRLVNRALARIGISKIIPSLATDPTEEGYQARLHYGGCAEEVLRDHPWSFATRYATLVRTWGYSAVPLTDAEKEEPVNADWQYAFLVPADCVFARRIVPLSGTRRKWNDDPIVFRLGELQVLNPATTPLSRVLFSNDIGTDDDPMVLEYTARVPCPASRPDAHFRSALAWKLAAALVAPLARDVKLIAYCEARYQEELAVAGASHENEQQKEKDGDADWISGR